MLHTKLQVYRHTHNQVVDRELPPLGFRIEELFGSKILNGVSAQREALLKQHSIK